jgi:hypothetical protein
VRNVRFTDGHTTYARYDTGEIVRIKVAELI